MYLQNRENSLKHHLNYSRTLTLKPLDFYSKHLYKLIFTLYGLTEVQICMTRTKQDNME